MDRRMEGRKMGGWMMNGQRQTESILVPFELKLGEIKFLPTEISGLQSRSGRCPLEVPVPKHLGHSSPRQEQRQSRRRVMLKKTRYSVFCPSRTRT